MTHGAKGCIAGAAPLVIVCFRAVFGNMRMPGHMGDRTVTTQNSARDSSARSGEPATRGRRGARGDRRVCRRPSRAQEDETGSEGGEIMKLSVITFPVRPRAMWSLPTSC